MFGAGVIGIGLMLMSATFLLAGLFTLIGWIVDTNYMKYVYNCLKFVFTVGGTMAVLGFVIWLGEFGYYLLYFYGGLY